MRGVVCRRELVGRGERFDVGVVGTGEINLLLNYKGRCCGLLFIRPPWLSRLLVTWGIVTHVG